MNKKVISAIIAVIIALLTAIASQLESTKQTVEKLFKHSGGQAMSSPKRNAFKNSHHMIDRVMFPSERGLTLEEIRGLRYFYGGLFDDDTYNSVDV